MKEYIDNNISLFLDLEDYDLLKDYGWTINNKIIKRVSIVMSEGLVKLYLNNKLLTLDIILELEDILDSAMVVTHRYIGTSRIIMRLGLC